MKIQEQVNVLVSREVVSGKWLVRAIGVTSFIILTTFGAYVWIPLPFTPVPITLQTFFVLLSGAVLGGKLGALSQLGYWVIGGLGLPLFASGAFGLKSLFGPTGGYLIGFIVASWMVGRLTSERKIGGQYAPTGGRSAPTGGINPAATFILGSIAIYFFGAGWLATFLHCSVKKAIFLGVLPFIPGDILKIIFATLIYKKFHLRFRQIYPVRDQRSYGVYTDSD